LLVKTDGFPLRWAEGGFFEHLRRHTFPGGCFFASAMLEMGTRPAPVKDRVRVFQQRFTGLICQYALEAQALGQLPADEDITVLASN
jgi:hypothetical protein